MKALAGTLALADGTIFRGEAFGAERGIDRAVVAEVVFNTSMYGYQEILTDPSYAGQTMCFTYPHIGNVGCNEEDVESDKIHTSAVVVRRISPVVSNFRARQSLSDWLEQHDIVGLSGVDTRAIVSHLRDNGAQMGAIATGDNVSLADLVSKARAAGSMLGKDYVQHVTCKQSYIWDKLPWLLTRRRILSQEALVSRPHVVAID